MKLALLSSLAVLALAAPAAAGAHGAQVTSRIAVPSRGLDLQNPVDAAVMLSRLDRAATRVCGASPFSAREHQAAVRRTACYRDAMHQVVASMEAPAVGAAYRDSARSASR